MIFYVSFSGGRTSAYLVALFEELKKSHPELDVRYVFMNTGAEHPDTYRFIKDVVSYFKINLNCINVVYDPVLGGSNGYELVDISDIRPDRSIWEGMLKKYGSPAVNIPFCTARMKTEPFDKFVKDDAKGAEFFVWLGIRQDEPSRLKPRLGYGYLANLSDVEKPDILRYWAKFDFDLKIPENLGNCVFCVKKDTKKNRPIGQAMPRSSESLA